ncbi:hypothetical protein BGZ60DRAFT_373021 [Tricladium varicosporioides]|nr:hypothetical protein BGZ60DRAFT_373021 [Hymenoscyphus varicosporioides]
MDKELATTNAARNKKKLRATATKTASTRGVSGGKAKVAKSTSSNKKSQVQAPNGLTKDKLSSLPPEILQLTLNNIKDPSTISALGRTCKSLYSIMMPRLYGCIAVAAMFHAHIPKLIRTLEPHLTIAQKKQLKKEGKYKGQQERYSSRLDEKAKPICATYVRQMIVGVADPGRKHRYIVDRYIEEAFKNMDNLEIVETRVLTKSIAQSLASLKNLKALRLFSSSVEAEDMKPLAKIKNLKHLDIQDYSGFGNSIDRNITQSILRNSMSTLQSLVVETNMYAGNFLQDWKGKAAGMDGTTPESCSFTALKSLSLSGITIDASAVKSLHKAIDFMRLGELTIVHFNDTDGLLLQYLTSFTSSQSTGTGINLRKLSLKMSDNTFGHTSEQKKAQFEAKCRFISSFGTLTTLELPDYGQYPDSIATNPGLADILLQAILKHKNLRCLRIPYKGKMSGMKVPYLSATTVEVIIAGLPQLQEFEFAPEEEQIDQIAEALVKSPRLKNVTCFPYTSWGSYPAPDHPGDNIISSILKAFLSYEDSKCTGKFVWEDHYQLRRVSLSWKTWDIASKFGKGEKGMMKPEKIKGKDEQREVWFRDVTRSFARRIHVGYDPDHEWVEKVDKEIL